MARFDFKLPDIGEGVSEGEVVEWHVKVGDSIVEDQPMVEVMTDKATVTIGAPKTGTILALGGKVGEIVKVGSVLVAFEVGSGGVAVAPAAPSAVAATHAAPAPATAGAALVSASAGAAPAVAAQAKKNDGPAATAVGDIKESLPGSTFFSGAKRVPLAAATAGLESVAGPRGNGAGHAIPAIEYFAEKPLATPATRKLARDLGLDLRKVRPSGPNGRVTKSDVMTAGAPVQHASRVDIQRDVTSVDVPAPTVSNIAPGRAPMAIRAPAGESSALEERKPFVGIRRKIAERMQTATNTAAHFTFVEECDVGALTALRDRLRPAAEVQGVKLSFLPFIAKAVVASLKKHPVLNSALDETTNELVYRRYYNLGIAAATEQGLMVPVVRNADRMSLIDMARDIDRLGNGARKGTLKSEELSGSTFTITSLGKQGGLFATPVLNFPEVGILGVHQIKEKPVVRNGQIVIGHVMLLSLSFDHRIVDGHVGAAFAYDIIGYLENPDRLFLEMA